MTQCKFPVNNVAMLTGIVTACLIQSQSMPNFSTFENFNGRDISYFKHDIHRHVSSSNYGLYNMGVPNIRKAIWVVSFQVIILSNIKIFWYMVPGAPYYCFAYISAP